MKKGQAHPAALLSKKMISDALIELLSEKSYSDITITELCAHSQIARRTFYRNFEKVDDALAFYIKGVVDDFGSEMSKHAGEPYYDVVVAYFTFWFSRTELLLLLGRNGLTHIIFTEYIKCLEQLPFLCGNEFQSGANMEEFPFIFAYTAGGLWSLLTYYISSGSTQSPQKIAQILTRKSEN